MPRMVYCEAYHKIIRIIVNTILSPSNVVSIHRIKITTNNPKVESSIPVID